MFETPLRSAALGVLAAAAGVLLIAQNDRLLRLLDRQGDDAARAARRERLRNSALILVGLALGMVVISEVLR